ncbi:MAG: hypothetical protein Q8N12_02355 [Thermodesulfovibrionales bacterium]|nr:hypothetical protein [Thermodesulfovibrionales bacterium]
MHTPSTKSNVVDARNKFMFIFKNLQYRVVTEREVTSPSEESIISKVTDDWREYEKGITQTQFITSPALTTFTDPLKESCSLLLTEDILNFCSKYDIYYECCKYYTLFLDSFKHIQKIDISISIDPEIQDCHHVSFILSISDSVENVLKYEDDFRDRLDKEISPDKRQFFVYNYSIA